MIKVLFVKPPFNPHVFVRRFACCEPYEFAFLAAGIRDIAHVAVVDMRLDKRTFASILNDEQPDIIGFTALTMDVNTVRSLARTVGRLRPQTVTCVGGEHATFLPKDFSADVDYIFTHGSFVSFRKFVSAIAVGALPLSQIITGAPAHTELSVQPDRSAYRRHMSSYVFGPAQPVGLWHSSSGCPHNCNFCSIITKDPKFRTVDIDASIKNLSNTAAADILSIDAHALANIKHAQELYRELANARLGKRLMISTRSDTLAEHRQILPVLRDGGVSVVSMGLEAIDDNRLATHNKGASAAEGRLAVKLLREHDILVRANFIISPDFRAADFQRLTAAIQEMGVDFPVFQILTPLPGTKLYDELAPRMMTRNYDYFDLSHSVVQTDIDFREFHEHFRRLFKANYSLGQLWRLARKLPLAHSLRGAGIALMSFSEMRYDEATGYA